MINSTYTIIAESPKSTVVAEYTPVKKKDQGYQSEAALENEFVQTLQSNGYEYIAIKNNEDLVKNLRKQLSALNKITFSDKEWDQFFNKYLANKNESIVEKTVKFQEDYIYPLQRDDGTTKNVCIIDKEHIHNNSLQVINQYEVEGSYKNRYDVTVLCNGIPVVHIELKKRGVALKEAFNQIRRYQRDSFWADNGLFEYVQLFVISNGRHTKYYSNTTRDTHVKEKEGRRSSSRKTSNSYEFTSWWTDGQNKRITDIVDFAKTFFSKHSLLSILTRYCVFTSDKLLLVMRPYQIAAAEGIINKIAMATNHKQLGTTQAGGYVWHTTGSGKTLTSFKTAQLASKLDYIDKVLFVVDRKDLDYQTMKEYDKFEKGAANSTDNTAQLSKQLSDPNSKIVITTIQKLAKLISTRKGHSIFDKHIVIIFDECHRSQFGEMHTSITKAFKNYHLFGFTGTPIVNESSVSGGNPNLKTTDQAFGQKLHVYTIVDAINDENVLPFRIDYANTIQMKEGSADKKVSAINTERALNAPERISLIVDYIIEHFDQKTKRNEHYSVKGKRLNGFNSILAVSSIDIAKQYYTEFKARNSGLKVATIYSFGANEDEGEDQSLDEEGFTPNDLSKPSRNFLESVIKDYNKEFGTNYDTSSEKFGNYYKDLSQRVKNREVDLLIVVNMFLTGFDATTLNTLWVDKNLRYHGLLQAFSRTNRILNSVKTFGNIVCFRDLEKATNDALSIFGNKDASGAVILKPYADYYNGWEQDGEHKDGYKDLINELVDRFPLDETIVGEQNEKAFIKLWGAILKLRNILSSFDDFEGNEILSVRDFEDYKSEYLDLYDKLRPRKDAEKEDINDDLVFEIDLIKQVDVNIDYILNMVAEYQKSKDKEILVSIDKAMGSSIELRSKRELIQRFINNLNVEEDINKDWHKFAEESKTEELEDIIQSENLKPEQTRKFVANAFRDGEIKSSGTAFSSILPAMPLFGAGNQRAERKSMILEKLRTFFEKYSSI